MDPELIPIYLVASVPVFVIIYFIYNAYQSHQLKKKNLSKGIGRGVAGFQTSVKRVAVPPEIIARIRRGEEVSAEEITRAQERMAMNSSQNGDNHQADSTRSVSQSNRSKVDEDWLPPSSTTRTKATTTQRKGRGK